MNNDNITNQILSTIADSYDSVRPRAGDCVREMITQEGERIEVVRDRPPIDFTIPQLAVIRRAILSTIGDQKWELYEGRRVEAGEVVVNISEDEATENRMLFAEAVQTELSEIVWEQKNSGDEATGK